MSIVKRISPGSAFKVGLVAYALLGLIVGLSFSLFTLVGAAIPGTGAKAGGVIFGALAVIILPLFYGLFGGIIAALGAAIYNIASGWVGGLSVEIS